MRMPFYFKTILSLDGEYLKYLSAFITAQVALPVLANIPKNWSNLRFLTA